MAMSKTISNTSDTEVRPDVRMLYYCLKLDNSDLSLKQVNTFLNEEYVSVSIKDIEKLFVYHNAIVNNILNDSCYNICAELSRSIVLYMYDTMGLPGDVLNITKEFILELSEVLKTDNPLEKAARIYTAITEHAVVKEHSKAFGYLMMVYSLQEDGYGLFVPDDDFITELLENNSICADDITRQLKMYLTVDITDEFVEKAIDIARTPVVGSLLPT